MERTEPGERALAGRLSAPGEVNSRPPVRRGLGARSSTSGCEGFMMGGPHHERGTESAASRSVTSAGSPLSSPSRFGGRGEQCFLFLPVPKQQGRAGSTSGTPSGGEPLQKGRLGSTFLQLLRNRANIDAVPAESGNARFNDGAEAKKRICRASAPLLQGQMRNEAPEPWPAPPVQISMGMNVTGAAEHREGSLRPKSARRRPR